MTDRPLYEIIGVMESATPDEIRRAWVERTKSCRPDKNPDSHGVASEEWNRLNEAYAVLSDPDKRRIYDETARLPGKTEHARDLAAFAVIRQCSAEVLSEDPSVWRVIPQIKAKIHSIRQQKAIAIEALKSTRTQQVLLLESMDKKWSGSTEAKGSVLAAISQVIDQISTAIAVAESEVLTLGRAVELFGDASVPMPRSTVTLGALSTERGIQFRPMDWKVCGI